MSTTARRPVCATALSDASSRPSANPVLSQPTQNCSPRSSAHASRRSPTTITTHYLFDDANRQIAVIENWQAGSPPNIDWDSTLGRWKVTSGLSASYPDQNRVTSYTYDDLGNVVFQAAHLPPESGSERVQVTQYVYGVSAGSVSDHTKSLIESADLLKEVRYPDESTGAPGSTSALKVFYAYNQLGELRSIIDQNGTQHDYARDDAGRVTEDRATKASGSNIDDTIRLITVTYDGSSRVQKVASLDAMSSGTKKNEIEYTYTPLWQVSRVFQNASGAVSRTGTTPGSDTRVVVFNYANTAAPASGTYTAASNLSRMTGMVYPKLSSSHSDHTLSYAYGSSGSIDDLIHRAATLGFSSFPGISGDLASYERLGLSMLAKATVVGYDLDYTIVNSNDRYPPNGTTGLRDGMRSSNDLSGATHLLDKVYAGYDRFGRIGTHIWATAGFGPRSDSYTNLPSTRQHFQENYSYDKASNRVTRDDDRRYTIAADRHENFVYDGLNRLTEAQRGVRSSAPPSSLTPAPNGQKWALDMLGNWSSVRTDLTGDGAYAAAGDLLDDRGAAGTSSSGHNMANELVQRIIKNGDGSSSGISPLASVYDDAGNMRTTTKVGTYAGDWRYTHDCWNRLVKVEKKVGGSYTDKVKYWYNGLHWRTQEIVVGALTGASGDKVTAMYYSPSWQLLWEETDESSAGSTSTWETKVDKTYANLYGLRGLDDLICRCIDGRTSGGTAPDGTYGVTAGQDACYVTLTDPQFSVREVMEAQNGGAIERWRYSAYGEPESLDLGDYNLDGMIDFFDYDDQYYELASPLAAPDDMRADVNGDGILDFFDADAFAISYDPGSYARPMPNLRHKYCGYLEDATSGLMLARFRWYDTVMGRWFERDPAGYIDGESLYQYAESSPIGLQDVYGLWCRSEDGTIIAMDGDTLGGLARRMYGRASKHKDISFIRDNHDKLYIGEGVTPGMLIKDLAETKAELDRLSEKHQMVLLQLMATCYKDVPPGDLVLQLRALYQTLSDKYGKVATYAGPLVEVGDLYIDIETKQRFVVRGPGRKAFLEKWGKRFEFAGHVMTVLDLVTAIAADNVQQDPDQKRRRVSSIVVLGLLGEAASLALSGPIGWGVAADLLLGGIVDSVVENKIDALVEADSNADCDTRCAAARREVENLYSKTRALSLIRAEHLKMLDQYRAFAEGLKPCPKKKK